MILSFSDRFNPKFKEKLSHLMNENKTEEAFYCLGCVNDDNAMQWQ